MSEKQTKIIQIIEDSDIKINKETGGICSMRYFSNHECNGCLRKRLCDYISNIEEKENTSFTRTILNGSERKIKIVI